MMLSDEAVDVIALSPVISLSFILDFSVLSVPLW